MPWTDDPVADFERHDREQARWLAQLPTCERCGDAILQETAVCINGFWYCDDCLYDYRKDVVEE